MWEDMYQMSLDTSGLGVERHSSLPEMSKNEFAEWKEKENPFARRSSFTTIPNTKKSNEKTKGCRRRRQQVGKNVDNGYITQTFLNERITWDEELNISSKSSAVKSKKQTISLKNSIQALLDANDSLVTDSYKTLNDAEEWSKSNDSVPPTDLKDVLVANGVVNGEASIIDHLQNGHSEGITTSHVKETALYSSFKENESSKLQYSYTIDAELSYQEYNKLMHIIVNTLREKRKWEGFIKEAEEKLDTANKERFELLDNNKVLRESLEAANKAIKDISSKVQKLKESLGPLRDENNYLKKENVELKDEIERLKSEKKIVENGIGEMNGTKESGEEKTMKETEMEEYKKNMHEKFRKLEEAYRNYRNEMESKHSDMNRTIDEMKQLYDSSKCNVDELNNETTYLKKEADALRAKNEQLVTEIKERWEADKKLITANTETQIRYEHSQKIEDEYKKQIKDTKEEMEKQKWEVFFSKEEATSLEKENKQLKSSIANLENKMKLMERKYDMVEKEREDEAEQNKLLKDEMKGVKNQLVEYNDLKRKSVEIGKEMETYKMHESSLQELRIEFESMKQENVAQKTENEKLKTDVEKLKNEAKEIEKIKTTQQPQENEVKRLLNEMESLRNQLQVLDGNQNLATGSQQDDIRVELESMRKEMSAFLENMQEKSEERETKAIKEDIGQLKRHLSELDCLTRSKSSSINGLLDSDKFEDLGTDPSDQDTNSMSEKESDRETTKRNTSVIQLVIDDDVVKWIDVPIQQSPKIETKFVKMNGHISVDKPMPMPMADASTCTNSEQSLQSEGNEIDRDETNKTYVVQSNMMSNEDNKMEPVQEEDDYTVRMNSKERFDSHQLFNKSILPQVKNVFNDSKKTNKNNNTDPVIYANIQKPRRSTDGYNSRSSSASNSLLSEEENNHWKPDKKISFKDESFRNHQEHQSVKADDHIYAVITNNKTDKVNIDKNTSVHHSSLPRPKKGKQGKKGLNRSNTYLHSDYRLLHKKYECEEDKENSSLVEKAMESRQTQAMIHKLKAATSTEAVSPSSGSPTTAPLSQSNGSISLLPNDYVGQGLGSNLIYNKNKSTDGERKPALPVRSMSRKKPNELFQTQRTLGPTVEENARPPERKLKPFQSKIPQNNRKPLLARAESMKVKGEEPYLYASIRKKTASESKESFLKRMDSANDIERVQIERMEAARQKAMEKASRHSLLKLSTRNLSPVFQDDISYRNATVKRKTVQPKPAFNQTASITVHGIPVRRNPNACNNTEYDDNKEFSVKNSRRRSSTPTAPVKPTATSKLKRVASLPRATSLAGDFKHLKNGIKNQFLKTKECRQKSFEFLTEESMKKYKYVRDTLKLKNLCLRSDKKIKPGGNSLHSSGMNGGFQGNVNTEIDADAIENDIDVDDEDFNPKDYLLIQSEEYASKTDKDNSLDTKVEAIYENASNYSTVKSRRERTLSKMDNQSPNKTFSYSDADLTSSSHEDDLAADSISWQRYYPTGETTPRHSLLSLV